MSDKVVPNQARLIFGLGPDDSISVSALAEECRQRLTDWEGDEYADVRRIICSAYRTLYNEWLSGGGACKDVSHVDIII